MENLENIIRVEIKSLRDLKSKHNIKLYSEYIDGKRCFCLLKLKKNIYFSFSGTLECKEEKLSENYYIALNNLYNSTDELLIKLDPNLRVHKARLGEYAVYNYYNQIIYFKDRKYKNIDVYEYSCCERKIIGTVIEKRNVIGRISINKINKLLAGGTFYCKKIYCDKCKPFIETKKVRFFKYWPIDDIHEIEICDGNITSRNIFRKVNKYKKIYFKNTCYSSLYMVLKLRNIVELIKDASLNNMTIIRSNY